METTPSRFSLPAIWRPRLAVVALALGVSATRAFAAESGAAVAPAVPESERVNVAPVVDKPLPPPADGAEMGPAPSPQHVWVPGHFHWEGGAYVWISGQWQIPPAGASWVQPRWESRQNGYVLVEGMWRQSAPPAPVVHSSPPPVVTSPAPPVSSPMPQANDVGPYGPPPPPPQEVRVERAGSDVVWIPGYWLRRGGHYVWVEGRWERPPQRGVVWVEPRWERRGRDYVFIEGYWREGAPVAMQPPPPGPRLELSIGSAPPPPRREVRDRAPGPGFVWVNGYWAWTGNRYIWMAGHWAQPPRGYRTWAEPRWERRGGNYVFIEGSWR